MRALLLLLVGVLPVAVASAGNPEPPPATDFVTRRGETLICRGQPVRFVGVNCYRLAEYTDDADRILGDLRARGARAVRFWAFQWCAGPTGRDFARFDRLVAAARRQHVWLLPVLDNHWPAFTRARTVKPPAWYARDWQTRAVDGDPLAYIDYLRAIGEHFRDEPQVLGWQLINEPEIYPDSAANFHVLRRFASEAAAALKRAAPRHLVGLGLLGIDQPSTTGPFFRGLHELRSIDFVSAHDYGWPFESFPPRGWGRDRNSIASDRQDAHRLGKPFLVTEAGIPLADVDGNRLRRAALFRRKLAAFFAAGGAGYFLWGHEPVTESPLSLALDDPVWDVVREIDAGLNPPGS